MKLTVDLPNLSPPPSLKAMTMYRLGTAIWLLLLLALSAPAQKQVTLRQLIGHLPFQTKEVKDSMSGKWYGLATADGHELWVDCRKDSSVIRFTVRPELVETLDSAKVELVKTVISNVFGWNADLRRWFDRAILPTGTPGAGKRTMTTQGWTLTVIQRDGNIARFVGHLSDAK